MDEYKTIELKFQRYMSVNQEPYYAFTAKEIFTGAVLISGKDYPKRMDELVHDKKIFVSVKEISAIANMCLLKNIKWMSV